MKCKRLIPLSRQWMVIWMGLCVMYFSAVNVFPRAGAGTGINLDVSCDRLSEKYANVTTVKMSELLYSGLCGCGQPNSQPAKAEYQELRTPVNLFKPFNFTYLVRPRLAASDISDMYMLCYIHSSVANLKFRNRIRKSWGDSHNYPWLNKTVKSVFVLGRSESKDIMEGVRKESEMFGDILVADFIDHYDNLTVKARAGLRYVSETFPGTGTGPTPVVLKSDDDMFINIFRVIDVIERYDDCVLGRRIICRAWVKSSPLRDCSTSKWCISRAEFAGDSYPDFCSGSSFVMSHDVARDLHAASLSAEHFRFDDVFVTGTLREKINVKLTDVTSQTRILPDKYGLALTSEVLESVIFLHRLADGKFNHLWSMHRRASQRGGLIYGAL